MNLKTHKLPRIILFVMLLSVGMLAALFYFSPTIDTTTSALTYSSSTDVSFTFAPKLSISLSDTNLVIDTLVPGQTSTSNAITITVASNTPYGYSLYADAGSNDTDSTYYNTSDLIHSDSTVNNTFTSIATNASLTQLTTDNTWGYSTSTDNGATWSTYSGLPTATSTGSSTSTSNPALLIDTKSPADSQSIAFKVAARSSTTQASGTYNNVINFYAVGKPRPVYMQEADTIRAELKNIGDEMQVMDNRDGKMYWVAMQADGNIWMVQNLDLCIGCEGTTKFTSQNTDLNIIDSGSYSNGYTNEGGVITWTPSDRASTSTINEGGQVFGWTSTQTEPQTADGGNIYIYSSGSNDDDVKYTSLTECISAGHSAYNCSHYHVGNYYNWLAATASNSSAAILAYESASNSICPSGWRLPKGQAASRPTSSTNEFGNLFYSAHIVGSIKDTSYYSMDSFNDLRTAPLFFVRGGTIAGSMYGGQLTQRAIAGYYWSSSSYDYSYSSPKAYNVVFNKSNIYPSNSSDVSSQYRYGSAVRCIMRQN